MEPFPDMVVSKAGAPSWMESLRNARAELKKQMSIVDELLDPLLENKVASTPPPPKTTHDKSPERKSLFAKSKEPKQSLFTEQGAARPQRMYTKTGLRYDIVAESPVNLPMIMNSPNYTWCGSYTLELSGTHADEWRSYFKANTPADTAKISKCLLKAGFVKQRKITS